MSFYSDASLALIPSGYKNGKVYSALPTDGSADLTFTRASNATRVASNGLIEKVRTNLCLQSNTFNTTWTTTNATVTSGQAGYDGTNNAWLLTKSGASGRINQSFSLGAQNTFSVYAKANASSYIAIEFDTSFIYVNLTNGAQGSIGAGSYKIESIGSGWYRIIMTSTSTSGIFRIYPAENNVLSATTGSIFIQNAQVETGDIATDYIATTTAAVSVGPVSGLPRLDYLNSSCPRLLLEPQRTSNVQFSEAFDNAYWTKDNVTLTSTLGGPIDQSKYFTITCNGTTGRFKGVVRTFINASPNTYTLSVFAKAGNSSTFVVSSRATLTTNDVRAIFNLSNGTITNTNGGTAAIVPYGDGWYRCSFTVVNAGTFTNEASIFFGHPHGAADGATVLATGAMSETGAYATSYIPTLGTSVTRVADVASKTGISSLIGQTEGTIFLEVDFTNISGVQVLLSVHDGAINKRFEIWADSAVLNGFIGGSVNIAIGNTTITNGSHKIALAYKQSGDQAFYVDGVQIGISATPYTIAALTSLSYAQYTGILNPNEGVKQTLLFKTRLSNSDLATLTTL